MELTRIMRREDLGGHFVSEISVSPYQRLYRLYEVEREGRVCLTACSLLHSFLSFQIVHLRSPLTIDNSRLSFRLTKNPGEKAQIGTLQTSTFFRGFMRKNRFTFSYPKLLVYERLFLLDCHRMHTDMVIQYKGPVLHALSPRWG